MADQTGFARACALSELPELGTHAVEIGGVPLVIVRSGGEVFALDELCSHEEISLADGEVYDHTLECWLHGSCFDLRTGKPTGPPATKPITSYQVRLDGDDVLVSVPDPARPN